MSCEYCKKNWEIGNEFDEYMELQSKTSSFLLRDSEGTVGLCLHFVDDENPFVDGNYLYVTSANHCPKCGRELVEQ